MRHSRWFPRCVSKVHLSAVLASLASLTALGKLCRLIFRSSAQCRKVVAFVMDRFCQRGRQCAEKTAHEGRSLQQPVQSCSAVGIQPRRALCLHLCVLGCGTCKSGLALQRHLLTEDHLQKKCMAP